MPDIRHNRPQSRFEATTTDGQTAVAEYRLDGARMVFTHTWVPPSSRGAGLAGHLVHEALVFAQTQGYTVDPRCSYVAIYLKRHPEFADLL